MKKFLVSVLLAIAPFVLSAQTISGFWGIPFGSSVEEVKSVMSKKGASVLFDIDDECSNIMFNKCEFAGHTDCTIAIFFVNKKMYKSVVLTSSIKESLVISTYDKVLSDLTFKYTQPQISKKEFHSPYYKGDGYEIQAIKLGKSSFAATWDLGENKISIILSDKLKVMMFYENKELGEIADKQNSASRSADY